MTKPIDAPTHFNAQQVAALEKDIRAKLDSVVKDVELRKWAVSEAARIATSPDQNISPDQAVTLAMQIYRFISLPLDEPMVTAPNPSA